MSRNCLAVWSITAAFAVLCWTWAKAAGFVLVFDTQYVYGGSGLLLLLIGITIHAHYRLPETRLSPGFHAFSQFAAFNAVIWLLTFPAASTAAPLMDAYFSRFDRSIGFDWSAHFDWIVAHPPVFWTMLHLYSVLLFQVPVMCLIVGRWDPLRLRVFVTANMVGLASALFISAIIGAGGAVDYYGIKEPVEYVQILHAVRDGTLRVMDPQSMVGLISFPSYHTMLAVFIAYACAGLSRWIALPVALLEAAIIACTPAMGGHHIADVIAGLVIAVLSIATARRLQSGPFFVGERSRAQAPGVA